MQTLRDLIIASFSFSDLQDEERNKMIDELADIAVQRSVIRALEKMSDAEVEGFEKTMGDAADPGVIFSYLEAQVPSFYDILRDEVARLQTLAAEENA